MAGNGKRGGDRVLESRHLVVFFLGVVLLCGVFFTLGYVMGKTQYGGSVHAESTEATVPPARKAPKPAQPETAPGTAPVPANSEWDFYSKNNNNNLEPATKPSTPKASGPAAAVRTVPVSARFQPPKMLNGSVVLQIAALTHQSDALAMADMLQQKKFPSFVVTPTTDNFYRVQVGPYSDQHAAESAKTALDHAGFKAIIKR
jgi:cell division septation protein DedD